MIDSTVSLLDRGGAGRAWSALRGRLFGPRLGWLMLTLGCVHLGYMFGGNWSWDEGNIALFCEHLRRTGELRYLYWHHNVMLVFGWPYFQLLALFAPYPLNPDYYFALRIPSFVFGLISLASINECLLVCVPRNASARALGLASFSLWWATLQGFTARYDSPYMAGIALTLLAIARIEVGGSWIWFVPSILVNSLAATSHPYGLISLAFLGLAAAVFAVRRRPPAFSVWLLSGLLALVLSALAVWTAQGRGLEQLLDDLGAVSNRMGRLGSRASLLEEIERYRTVTLRSGGWWLIAATVLALIPCRPWTRSLVVLCGWGGLWMCSLALAFDFAKFHNYLLLPAPLVSVVATAHLVGWADWRWRRDGHPWGCVDDLEVILTNRSSALEGMRRISLVVLLTSIALTATVFVQVSNLAYQARRQSLFVRLIEPRRHIVQIEEWREKLQGRKLSLYSDPRAIPMFASMDLSECFKRQGNLVLGEHYQLAPEGEYVLIGDWHREQHLSWLSKHPRFERELPPKIGDFWMFGQEWSIYRIEGGPAPAAE